MADSQPSPGSWGPGRFPSPGPTKAPLREALTLRAARGRPQKGAARDWAPSYRMGGTGKVTPGTAHPP